MNKQVVFTEAQAKRIWAATKQMEQMASKAAGYDRFTRSTPRELPLYIRNKTGRTLPPYSAVVIDNFDFEETPEAEDRVDLVADARLPIRAALHSRGFASSECVPLHEQQLRGQQVFWTGAESVEPDELTKVQTGDVIISRFRRNTEQLRGEQNITATVSLVIGQDYVALTQPSTQGGNLFPELGCAVFLGVLPERTSRFAGEAEAPQAQQFEIPILIAEGASLTPQPSVGSEASQTELALIRPFFNFQSTAWAYVNLKADTLNESAKTCTAEMIYSSGDYFPDEDVTVKIIGNPTAIFDRSDGDIQDTRLWVFRPTSPLNYRHNIDDSPPTSPITEIYPASNVFFAYAGGSGVDCAAVKDCLEDEDFEFCELVKACLEDEDFNDFFCEKVRECLDLDEDEDIDDRIDQRLQELCTCETFIDGVSI